MGYLTEETHGKYVDSIWNSPRTLLIRFSNTAPSKPVGGFISNILRGRKLDTILRADTKLVLRCKDSYEVHIAWVHDDPVGKAVQAASVNAEVGGEMEGKPVIVRKAQGEIEVAWVNGRGIAQEGKPKVVYSTTRILAKLGSMNSR